MLSHMVNWLLHSDICSLYQIEGKLGGGVKGENNYYAMLGSWVGYAVIYLIISISHR